MCLVSHYARLDTSENHLTGSIFCCFFSFFVVAITLITAHRIFSAICIRHRVASALLCVFRLSSVCDVSDHDPIVMSLNIDWNFIARAPRHYADKCVWHKASEQNLQMYKHSLKINLSAVQLPIDAITCHEVACNNKTHFSALNDYSNALITACLAAASHAIPRNSRSNGNRCSTILPGWNEHVAPLREKSVFWHDIWVSSGRPHDGIVASIMRRTRALYHYAVRYIKRNRQDIIKDRFASAILDNRDRDFWREAKKVGGDTSGPHSIVDGLSQPTGI
jgi:hypothetical protein